MNLREGFRTACKLGFECYLSMFSMRMELKPNQQDGEGDSAPGHAGSLLEHQSFEVIIGDIHEESSHGREQVITSCFARARK